VVDISYAWRFISFKYVLQYFQRIFSFDQFGNQSVLPDVVAVVMVVVVVFHNTTLFLQ